MHDDAFHRPGDVAPQLAFTLCLKITYFQSRVLSSPPPNSSLRQYPLPQDLFIIGVRLSNGSTTRSLFRCACTRDNLQSLRATSEGTLLTPETGHLITFLGVCCNYLLQCYASLCNCSCETIFLSSASEEVYIHRLFQMGYPISLCWINLKSEYRIVR